MDIYKRGRWTITTIEGRHLYWCKQINIVMLILNNVFNFKSGSNQSSGHNICFYVIFANSSLGHNTALGPVQSLLCPVLTFQRFKT